MRARFAAASSASARLPVSPILRQLLEERIATGDNPPGSWLPSIRELAADTGINRNTISKVYQSMMRDGLIEAVTGRGVRVTSSHGRPPPAAIAEELSALARRAKTTGVSREWLVNAMTSTAAEVYDEGPVRIGLIECNEEGAGVLSEDLSKHLGHPVDPVLLHELSSHADLRLAPFDIVTTTLFHLQEVNALVDGRAAEVVGINHEVSYESILEIARLEPGIRIAVVCPNERTLDRVEGIVRTYARGEIVTCTAEDRASVSTTLNSVDAAITTSSTHHLVEKLRPELPRVIVRFHIQEQSVEYLRAVVRRHARDGGSRVPAAVV